MKNLVIKLGIFGLRFIYFFLKLLPQKKRIVMLSRESDSLPIDFLLLSRELKETLPEYEVLTLCELLSSKDVSVLKTAVYTLKSMVLLSSAQYCVIDTYNVAVSVLKHRKKFHVMQIWHALGGLKEFGLMSLGKEGGHDKKTAELLCMHKNYDTVCAASHCAAELYEKAFGCKKENIEIIGMPRIDYILDGGSEKKLRVEEIKEKYPVLSNGKKNILYAPTFRADGGFFIDEILDTVDFSKYNLCIKIHDVDKKHSLPENAVNIESSLFNIFPLADYIITDYSASACEAALTKKPLFFYTYDIDGYKKERGLFIDPLKEYPSISSKSFKDIYAIIDGGGYDFEALGSFLNRTVETADTCNTKRIANKIRESLK